MIAQKHWPTQNLPFPFVPTFSLNLKIFGSKNLFGTIFFGAKKYLNLKFFDPDSFWNKIIFSEGNLAIGIGLYVKPLVS